MIKSVVIAGTGNVGSHLALAFRRKGIHVMQLYNRTPGHALGLSAETGAPVADSLGSVTPRADLYIFSVNDSSLPSLIKEFPHKDVFAVHTSGSVPMSVFSGEFSRHGVLYPLQTFSKDVGIEYAGIPLCIEADSASSLDELRDLSELLTGKYYTIDSEQRARLHLAAVFACNFTNYLYSVAEEVVRSTGEPFDLLRPLIMETARKVMQELPENVQTGPAARNDADIIRKHLSMLAGNPKHEQVYRLLTSFIKAKYNPDDEL